MSVPKGALNWGNQTGHYREYRPAGLENRFQSSQRFFLIPIIVLFFQKFRFCGEGDCPDWVLAEIISTLSNLSVENLEQLAQLVAKRISGEPFEVC